MIARRLSIDPALLVSMFSRTDAWRVVSNRLPEDAKVEQFEGIGSTIHLWITSSVFRDDDPMDLPAVKFEAVPISLVLVPRELSREECHRFEADLQAMMARSDRKVTVCGADGNPI